MKQTEESRKNILKCCETKFINAWLDQLYFVIVIVKLKE